MSGVSRFDCYPSDFLNGIVGMTADQIAAYTVLMMVQYDRGVPVQYAGRERELSVRTGLPRGRLAKAVDDLVTLGKLHTTEAGGVYNTRTAEELEKISQRISKNVENSLSGGEATKKKWEQIRNQNNGDEGPDGRPTGKPKQGPISPPSSLPPPSKEVEATPLVADGPATLANVVAIDRKPSPERAQTIRRLGEWWNDTASSLGMKQIERIEGGREVAALSRAKRLREDFGTLDAGLAALEAKIRGSPFLQGKTGWRGCTFDWVMKAGNFQKILEDNYDGEIRQAKRG